MLRRPRLILPVLLVLVACVAGSSRAATSNPQVLVRVNATGGLCPPSMCHWSARITTTTISAEGRRARRITAAERPAQGRHAAEVQGHLPDRLRRPGAPLPLPRQGRDSVVQVRPAARPSS